MKLQNKMTELCYTLCIAYMLGFNILYKLTGFPYTMICLMLLVSVIHFATCKSLINFSLTGILIILLSINFVRAFCLFSSKEIIAYSISFFSLGLMGFYCSLFRVNEQSVFRNVAIILIIYMFFVGGFKDFQDNYFNTSCTVLPGICCCFLYAKSLQEAGKKNRALMWYGISLFFSFCLLKAGSRSCVVSLIGFWGISILIIGKSRILKILCISGGLLGGAALFKIEEIILYLDQWITERDINLFFITKSAFKIKNGTLSSGRGELVKNVFDLKDILQILWGRGISGYENEYGTYPHNIFLDIFADFGLVGIIITAVILVLLLRDLKWSNPDEKKMYILLIGSCIFPLLFSFSYWRFPAVFLLAGLVLSKIFYLKRRR